MMGSDQRLSRAENGTSIQCKYDKFYSILGKLWHVL